jgi:hypothetical protein
MVLEGVETALNLEASIGRRVRARREARAEGMALLAAPRDDGAEAPLAAGRLPA